MRVLYVLFAFVVMAAVAGCAGQPTEPATSGVALTPQVHASLAQLMRGIPFPNSNTIFDTQDKDPEAPPEGASDIGAGATAAYGNLYGGWQGVENAALAIAETANLLMVPGRVCENGLPVPLDREDFRQAVQGLAAAGEAAYKAAQTKNLDNMIEAAGTVSDACAACHEIYRDKPEGEMRCIP